MINNEKIFKNTIKEKEEMIKFEKDKREYEIYFIRVTEQDEVEVHYNSDGQRKAYLYHCYCFGGKINFENFKKYNILYCEKCNLRIGFPQYINKLKELKKYFENKFKEKTKKVTRAELIDLED